MACNHVCGLCNKKLKTTTITIEEDEANQTLQLAVPQTTTRQNNKFCLIIANNIPSGAGTIPVTVSIGGAAAIPVYTKTGNILRADQIKSRKSYRIIFGDDPAHFILECYIPESAREAQN